MFVVAIDIWMFSCDKHKMMTYGNLDEFPQPYCFLCKKEEDAKTNYDRAMGVIN